MIEKISVIIITRNRAKMLTGCLKSLVKQTRIPDEVVFVDNASSDNTKNVVLSFKDKLPIKYVLEKQIGVPYARNNGLRHSSGSLILVLDDDCEADRFWVENMVKAHNRHPKAWAIQGRTTSLPEKRLYSLIVEHNKFRALQRFAAKKIHLNNFFSKDFRDEIELSICDTKNLSIKTHYLKKYNLSFDNKFYRGSDVDLSRQILQKNGIIMFCPNVVVGHYERSTLTEFLKQRWHNGRGSARIADKWKTPPEIPKTLSIRASFFSLLPYCKAVNQLHKFPLLIVLLFLDRLYCLNGYFYEKRLLSLEKQ